MVPKTLTFSCPECGIEYSITSTNWESVQYCPFCGDGNLSPYDSDEDEDYVDPFADQEFGDDD